MNSPSDASVFQPMSCQSKLYSVASSLRFCTVPEVAVVVTCAVDMPFDLRDERLVVMPTDAPKPAKLEPTVTARFIEALSDTVFDRSVPTEVLYASVDTPPE